MDMPSLIKLYLESKVGAWSSSTLKSEKARLEKVVREIDGNAQRLWDHLKTHYKPYSRVTVWSRVTSFWSWCIEEGYANSSNPYAKFRSRNARLFKNQYQRRQPSMSFEDATKKIEGMDGKAGAKARQLILSGMRFSESSTLREGEIIGKGSKRRRIYNADLLAAQGLARPISITHSKFYRELKKQTGLTPHDLRKVFITHLVAYGANVFDLCKIAGWSSIETAMSYVGTKDDRLERLIAEAVRRK